MRVDGRTIPTFNINTLPLTGEPDEATYRQVLEQSRARFTKPKELLKAPVPKPFEAAFDPTIEALDED